jgi:tyrosine-specific transport protein
MRLADLTIIAPILFTSFGFHGTIPSVTKLCRNDVRIVKLACLWGGIIPACVYTIWIASSLCLLKSRAPGQFQNLANGSVNLGEFIAMLNNITNLPIIGTITWVIATLAIVTSIFGVELSLVDKIFKRNVHKVATHEY